MRTNSPSTSAAGRTSLVGILQLLFLVFIFLQGFMKPGVFMFGQTVMPADLFFPAVFSVWAICLVSGKTGFRFHRIYWFFLLYFLTAAFSVIGANDQARGLIKLSGELYLIALAIMTFNLVRNIEMVKKVFQTWLAGTFIVLLIGLFSILLFYFQPDNPLLRFTLYHSGAVPVGNYPRLNSTFISPSLLCNYLVVSLFILYAAGRAGWLKRIYFHILHSSLWLCAVFTISSGLGAFALGIGIWVRLFFKRRRPKLSKIVLPGGILGAILFLFINFVALKPYPAPPFVWKLPVITEVLYPSPRVLVWMESFDTFKQNPLFGKGLGQPVAQVIFQNTDGRNSLLTEAHNMYLNVAAQTGLFGLTAFLVLLFFLVREFWPWSTVETDTSVIRNALGISFLCAVIYQGLVGSFEETRHLWILTGLLLSFGHSANSEKSVGGLTITSDQKNQRDIS